MRILSNQSRHFVLLSSVILALGGCAHAELKPGNCGALASLEVECGSLKPINIAQASTETPLRGVAGGFVELGRQNG